MSGPFAPLKTAANWNPIDLFVSFVLLPAARQHLSVLPGGIWLHGLFLVIVVFMPAGALTVSLFLFLDFLPLPAVNRIPTADMLVGAVLDHTSQTSE